MKYAILLFPGSNCDRDCHHAIVTVAGGSAEYVWHKATRLPEVDAVILPGGFSYGDYLRAGAIARQSPIMGAVKRFAEAGGAVLGICNGFQILTEAGLLPGVLMRNAHLRFECRDVHVRVENTATPFTRAYANRRRTQDAGRRTDVICMPIAHMEGNYFVDPATLARMEGRGQTCFRYCDPEGNVTPAANPNGSLGNIAGVCNEQGNVVGLMPHPERRMESLLGGMDGTAIFQCTG